jgi:hypothetical protein
MIFTEVWFAARTVFDQAFCNENPRLHPERQALIIGNDTMFRLNS